MNRSIAGLVLLVCGGLTLVACKKKEEEGATTGAAATATATATAADTATAAPADSAAPSAAPSAEPTAPPTTVVPIVPQSIDGCCAALDGVRGSGRGKDAKRKSQTAAKVCHSAAPRVRAGQTSRQSALQSVRAQLHGVEVPAACQ